MIVLVKVGGASCGGGVAGRARYLGGIEGGAPTTDGLGQRQERAGEAGEEIGGEGSASLES